MAIKNDNSKKDQNAGKDTTKESAAKVFERVGRLTEEKKDILFAKLMDGAVGDLSEAAGISRKEVTAGVLVLSRLYKNRSVLREKIEEASKKEDGLGILIEDSFQSAKRGLERIFKMTLTRDQAADMVFAGETSKIVPDVAVFEAIYEDNHGQDCEAIKDILAAGGYPNARFTIDGPIKPREGLIRWASECYSKPVKSSKSQITKKERDALVAAIDKALEGGDETVRQFLEEAYIGDVSDPTEEERAEFEKLFGRSPNRDRVSEAIKTDGGLAQFIENSYLGVLVEPTSEDDKEFNAILEEGKRLADSRAGTPLSPPEKERELAVKLVNAMFELEEDPIRSHFDAIEGKQYKQQLISKSAFTEEEILTAINGLTNFAPDHPLRAELEIIADKSPYESVRKAAKEKLSSILKT